MLAVRVYPFAVRGSGRAPTAAVPVLVFIEHRRSSGRVADAARRRVDLGFPLRRVASLGQVEQVHQNTTARNWARHHASSSGTCGCCAPTTSFSVPTPQTGPTSLGRWGPGAPAGSRPATPSGSVSVPPRCCGPGLSPRFANWHPRLRPATRPDGKRLVASLSKAQAPPGRAGPEPKGRDMAVEYLENKIQGGNPARMLRPDAGRPLPCPPGTYSAASF
jgi:hypothetical protein